MAGDRKEQPKAANEDKQSSAGDIIVTGNGHDSSVVDRQITELQEQLAEAKDSAREYLFYYILTAVIVADVFAFTYMGNNIGIPFLVILEIVLLLGLAKKLGVEEAAVLLAAIYRKYLDKDKKD